MIRTRILRLAAACLLWSAARPAAAQDTYRRVDTGDLARNPRKYFALPILYRDTLLSVPAASRIRLDRQSYHPFSAKTLGVCYATAELRDRMLDLPLGRDYFFTGTVLPQGSRFYVIAQSFSPAVDEEAATGDPRTEAKGAGAAALQEALRNIQSVHLAYAKGNQIELCELYDPKSPHYAKAMDLARAELSALEQKEKTDSIEILARYTVGVLADKCLPPAAATAAVETASAEIEQGPVPEPDIEEELVEETESESPPARSWWARRKERRAAAAEERARPAAEREAEEEADVEEVEPETLPAPEIPATPAGQEPAVPSAVHEPVPFAPEPEPAAESEPARTNLTWSQRRALAREKEADLRAKEEKKAQLERDEARRRKEEAQRAAAAKKREARERKQAEREKKEEARRAAEAARAAKAAADAGELSPTANFELQITPPTAENESLKRAVAE